MKSLSRNNATLSLLLLVLLLVSCVTTNAWLPQRNYGMSRPTTPACLQRHRSNTASMLMTTRRKRNHSRQTECTKNSRTFPRLVHLSKRNVLLGRFAAGLVCMLLLPLRVSASTTPLAASEPVVAAAAPVAAAAYCAAPPVPAWVETKLTIRLVYAALLGAGLGKERSFAKHSAGVRTMALVAMGASAYTVCSAYGFANFGHYDPGRMASNVASGVGFVGAGVITTSASRNENVVHGLTTAATIWLSAAVGVACGVGLFQIATMASVMTVSILRLGRMNPKQQQQKQQQQASSSKHKFEVEQQQQRHQAAETYADDDEDDFEDFQRQAPEDHYADTHDTSDWDEKQHQCESPPVEFISQPSPPEEKIIVTEDNDVGSIVEHAWRNSTGFCLNSTTLVK
jgi:putative Mg2+ transporter-C (MgtC) family protein